MGNLPTHKN